MILAKGFGKETMLNFDEFLNFMLPSASPAQISKFRDWALEKDEAEASKVQQSKNTIPEIPEEELESLLSHFSKCDVDGDGKLTKYEFRRAFLQLTKKEIDNAFRGIDTLGTGFITKEEFIDYLCPYGYEITDGQKAKLRRLRVL